MKLDVYNLENEKVSQVEVSDAIFGAEVKPYLFHEVVRMQLAGRRRGTHKTKTRSEVAGGGRKPFRQKGTGRARQGTTRAPHWVGGGHAFARRPRDYSFQLNKSAKRAAIKSALSMLVGEGKFKVINAFELEQIKTKEAAAVLKRLGVESAVVVDGRPLEGVSRTENNDNLRLSVRNLPRVKYLRPEGVNVYDLLQYGSVLVTEQSLKGLEKRLER